MEEWNKRVRDQTIKPKLSGRLQSNMFFEESFGESQEREGGRRLLNNFRAFHETHFSIIQKNKEKGIKGVAEAAAVGVPDEIFGQAIKAFIVCRDGEKVSEERVKKFCMENLEPFMVPKYVEFRKSLPKSSHGKVDKKAL